MRSKEKKNAELKALSASKNTRDRCQREFTLKNEWIKTGRRTTQTSKEQMSNTEKYSDPKTNDIISISYSSIKPC